MKKRFWSHSNKKQGVVFCSVSNFYECYIEPDESSQGVESLQMLNEIIEKFDELVHHDERFHTITKVQAVRNTYIATVGFDPDHNMLLTEPGRTRRRMTNLLDFVKALRITLNTINEYSHNNFMLRVGVHIGPVVSGYIGSNMNQYNIWGSTVTMASRMESTGIPGYTQVTQEVVDCLQGSHFEFRCRGKIKVNGKGDIVTYILIEQNDQHLSATGLGANGGTAEPVAGPSGVVGITGSSAVKAMVSAPSTSGEARGSISAPGRTSLGRDRVGSGVVHHSYNISNNHIENPNMADLHENNFNQQHQLLPRGRNHQNNGHKTRNHDHHHLPDHHGPGSSHNANSRDGYANASENEPLSGTSSSVIGNEDINTIQQIQQIQQHHQQLAMSEPPRSARTTSVFPHAISGGTGVADGISQPSVVRQQQQHHMQHHSNQPYDHHMHQRHAHHEAQQGHHYQQRQPNSDRSFQPISDRSFQPISDRSFQPISDRSFQPISDRSFQPISDRSFQPYSQSVPNPLQYQHPRDIQVDPTSPPRMIPINEGESSNSFEYHERGPPCPPPFEREPQRRMNESQSRPMLAQGFGERATVFSDQHPQMERNMNPSESSHLQTYDMAVHGLIVSSIAQLNDILSYLQQTPNQPYLQLPSSRERILVTHSLVDWIVRQLAQILPPRQNTYQPQRTLMADSLLLNQQHRHLHHQMQPAGSGSNDISSNIGVNEDERSPSENVDDDEVDDDPEEEDDDDESSEEEEYNEEDVAGTR